MTKQTCGKTTVEVDARCAWTCSCIPGKACTWTVSCPDGAGGWIYTSGDGLVANPPDTKPHIKVAGELAVLARILSRVWKRPVTVASADGKKRVARTLSGTPEEIAAKLGLTFGTKGRATRKRAPARARSPGREGAMGG